VQLAKADGLRVIADASQADQALVSSLGAQVVVRRGDDVADRRSALPATWAGYRTQNSQAFATAPCD